MIKLVHKIEHNSIYDEWLSVSVLMSMKSVWWWPVKLWVGLPKIRFVVDGFEFGWQHVVSSRLSLRVGSGEHVVRLEMDCWKWLCPWGVQVMYVNGDPVELS